MLGWAIAFFAAALVAALFGYGAIATAFVGVAKLLFWVFLGLFALSLIVSFFRGRHAHAHGGTSHAAAAAGRTVALLAIAAAVGVIVYAWVDGDMSAEKLGRNIDRNAVEFADATGEMFETAGDRAGAFLQSTGAEVREDAAEALDEAGERVEPDNAQTASN